MLRPLSAMASIFFTLSAIGQSGTLKLTTVPGFEVSVVRPDRTEHEMAFQFSADGISAEGITLDTLIRIAYSLDDGQVLGEPKWANSTKYTIHAKVAPESLGVWQKLTPDQSRMAIRNLLTTSFHLKVHWEPKVVAVFDLVLLRGNSSRLEKHRSNGIKPEASSPMEAYSDRIDFASANLDALCTVLSSQMERRVVNKTGVSGDFKFKLRFEPVEEEPKGLETNSSLPSLYNVLKEELGLQLISHKENVSMLIVENASRPQVQ